MTARKAVLLAGFVDCCCCPTWDRQSFSAYLYVDFGLALAGLQSLKRQLFVRCASFNDAAGFKDRPARGRVSLTRGLLCSAEYWLFLLIPVKWTGTMRSLEIMRGI